MGKIITAVCFLLCLVGISHADPFPSYAEYWGEDYTLNINGADTYFAINATNGAGGDGIIAGIATATTANVSFSNATGIFTIGSSGAGIYELKASLSCNAASTNVIHGAFFLNGVEQVPCHFERAMGTANDIGSASGQCFLTLSANDIVDLRVTNNADTDVEFTHINVSIVRVE